MTFAPRKLLPGSVATPRLEMPDQRLTAAFRDGAAPVLRTGWPVWACRAFAILCPLGLSAALVWLWIGWFSAEAGLTVAEVFLATLSGFVFFWMGHSAATAILGLGWTPRPAMRAGHGLKVAILLPMYGEPAAETIGRAVELLAGLCEKGGHAGGHDFALHILSDTPAPVAALLEDATVAVMRRRYPGLSLAYRRRARNTDYKSGNIRDWVITEGHAHDAMLILDADSVMGPGTVIRLCDAMAQDPGLGLIQTIPRVLAGKTVWQGLQSFASEVYGTNMGRGFARWTGCEGNFFGHNALVRISAFAASAGLPHLSGMAPRGGVILSHDFVEAALLRRAGWGVQMVPEAEESHEDTPETLIGYLRRDQRWCQGNLQHLRLLRIPGLHPLSRFHLLQGAMAYLSSVCWLLLLLLWALVGQQGQGALPALPLPEGGLAPSVPPASIAGGVVATLVAPKVLGIVAYLRGKGLRAVGVARFAGLATAELLVSALLAPALMVHQVRAVLRILRGNDGGWMPHATGRADLRTLLRFHRVETGLGLLLLSLSLGGMISLWLLPIGLSLCLTVPLAAVLQMPRAAFSRRRAGARGA